MVLRLVITKMLVFLSITLLGCEQFPAPDSGTQRSARGVYDSAISDDGQYSLVSSVNHGVSLWRLSDNERLYDWTHGVSDAKGFDNEALDRGILHVTITPDNFAAITAEQLAFGVWSIQDGSSLGYWQTPANIRAITASNRASRVAVALANHTILFVNMTTGRRLEITGHGEVVNDVTLSANGRYLFSAGNDFRAILWDTKEVKPIFIWEHDNRVTTVALSADGAYAFSSGIKGDAIIWDLRTGKQHAKLNLKRREYVTSSASFSPDNRYLATGHAGRHLKLWDVNTGKKVDTWMVSTRDAWKPTGAIVYAVAFTPDSKKVISESSSGWGETWRISHRLIAKSGR
ncbi:MAG: hypothetical protein AAGB12_01975 [Pseudomonadota bacterium]